MAVHPDEPADDLGEKSGLADLDLADDELAGHYRDKPGMATRIVDVGEGGGDTIHLRRCRLIRTSTDGQPKAHVFDQPTIRIGALADNDLVVSHDTVSRFHCQIIQEEEAYLLKDLGSTNGTFVDGVRIREAFLSHGSRIKLGEAEVVFEPFEERIQVEEFEDTRYGEIVGQSSRMRQIFHILDKIAPSSATVVVEGETGAGKEVVARTLHMKSNRAEGPFIVVDCGAVPENLIESELFGHERGAFTGANRSRQGLFELANRGTLFLDELGELSLDLQPKLLRALESREVRPVGSNKPRPVDVRVVAATNRDLATEVREGRFRQDLYYRLSVVRLTLPPLRDRRDDVALLVEHFLDKLQSNRSPQGHRKLTSVAAPAMRALQAYDWPGNVRELANVVERACSFSNDAVMALEDLPDHIARLVTGDIAGAESAADITPDDVQVPGDLADLGFKEAKETWLTAFESDYIEKLLKKNDGNISSAAREADIDRKYFRKLMKKYGIETP